MMAATSRRARARTGLDPARRAAYDALRTVDTDDAYLNLVLPRLLTERGVVGRDAAFATELAAGTSRLQGSYDAILGTLARDGADELQPAVRTALRLGSHQLLSMRVPSHAAVGTTVELVRADVGERPVRLVNAVLRRVGERSLEDWLDAVSPRHEVDPVGHLAVRYSHPRWVVEAFAAVLDDPKDVTRLLAADNVAPAVTLAGRPGLAAPSGDGIAPGRWSPYAGILEGGDPGALPEVRDGRLGVQDEGSQLMAIALAAAPVDGADSRWLDLCAGPGGKAALLTGLARESHATVIANERLPRRAALVRSGLRAYGPPATVVCGDGTRPPWRAESFDRVIVDAPCSGLGALRRRPESRWRRTPGDVAQLVPLQRALLASALDATRPGGVVAYVTCSPHQDETRGVVDAVLGERADTQEEDARDLLPGVPDLGPGPHAQLWPHVHGTDAMFFALLRKS